ncbi:MAG: DegT/DnrJ/EryC1/StrS family aminotransferase [Elusimicrobia bacterium]|nr:DegT/DnrJ/EryC1/StrS family aminotransferase [Elusimicrobiota bacterium]
MDNLALAAAVYAPPPAATPWRLEDLAPGHELTFHSFGRRALAAGLRASDIGPGENVLFPEFICRDLLSAAAAVGARPAFYPVSAELEPASPPETWPGAKAVVAVNFFGFPQSLAPFRDYCRRTGAILIEDNAHGLFSRDEDGRLLGLRADMGIFSLRKSLALPNGAALALSGGRAWKSGPAPTFAPSGDLRFKLKNSYRMLAGACGARASLAGLRLFRTLRRLGNGSSTEKPAAERELPLPAEPCLELSRPIAVADPEIEAARRRELYALVENALCQAELRPVFEALPEGVVPYGYPFRAEPQGLPKALAALKRLGLYPLPWPDLPDSVAARAPKHYKNVWLAHFLW